MKKYSKLIVLTVVMLVAWTVFYVHAHQITDSFVRFSIKTIEGDESLIEHVVIRGDMSSSNFTYEPFVLTKDGTTFMRETSFIERISDYHKSEKVKQLQLKHRQFMRGKNVNSDNYATTDDKIVYADFIYSKFNFDPEKMKIETLDKNTNEKKTAVIDNPELNTFAYIEKVIAYDEGVYVAVENLDTDYETDMNEITWNIYHYEFSRGTFDEPIVVSLGKIPSYNNITQFFVDDENDPKEMIVLAGLIDYAAPEDEASGFPSYEEEIVSEYINLSAIKKVDLKTGNVTDINMETDQNGIPVGYNGKELLFIERNAAGLHYHAYDIETKKTTTIVSLPLEGAIVSYWDFSEPIQDGRLIYTLLNSEYGDNKMILVIDEKDKELVYKGAIEPDRLIENRNGDEMIVYFNEMEIVD